jgi:hypothetical protein
MRDWQSRFRTIAWPVSAAPTGNDRTWHRRHSGLLQRTHLDLGYRLLIADVS